MTFDGSLDRAETGDAVTLVLSDEIEVGRGEILVSPTARPEVSEQFAAHIIWMDQKPLFQGRSYLLRIRGIRLTFPKPAETPTECGPNGIRFDFNDDCRVFLPGWRAAKRAEDRMWLVPDFSPVTFTHGLAPYPLPAPLQGRAGVILYSGNWRLAAESSGCRRR